MAYGRINVGGGKDLTAELNQQAQIIEELETKLDAIGAVDITPEVQENTDLIAQVMAELQGKAFAPAIVPVCKSGTATNSSTIVSNPATMVIPHGLGKIPTAFGLTGISIYTDSNDNRSEFTAVADETNITVTATMWNKSGMGYLSCKIESADWFAMA